MGDKEVIERVFVNLLTNAIKYTSYNGEVLIECERLAQLHENKSFIKISVTDLGQEISKHDIKEIIDNINIGKNVNLHKWKQEIENCLFTLNEEKYNELTVL